MGNTHQAKKGSNSHNTTKKDKASTPTEKKKPPKAKYYYKLLLVGTSSCGKSTLAKQMKILHCDNFTEEERSNYRKILIFNMCCAMQELITKAREFNYAIENELLAQNVSKLDVSFEQQLTMENINDIKKLWEEKAIQAAFARRNEFDSPTNVEYCISRAPSLIDPQYQLTNEDILRARQRTTGITETEFQIGKFTWNLVDVGGQRAERRKWVHYYEGAVAMLFVASLDDFDAVLPENPTKTRMEESIEVFNSMINHEWFARTPWILFLNKKDIFRTKIQTTDMKQTYPDYKGGKDFDQGVKYIERLYVKCLKTRDPQSLYVHVTCALDTQQVKFVFDSVSEWIFQQRVIMSGIS